MAATPKTSKQGQQSPAAAAPPQASSPAQTEAKPRSKPPPSKQAVEVIELSSDSSDGSDLSGDESGVGSASTPARPAAAAAAAAAATAKPGSSGSERSSAQAGNDDGNDDEPLPSSQAGDSPASKRQRKLAVRVKEPIQPDAAATPATAGKKSLAGTGSGGSSAVKKTPSTHVRFGDDDDDGKEQFFTPLETPGSNPLDAAGAAASLRKQKEQRRQDNDGVEDGESEGDDDDDAPPEAVSSHAAALENRKLDQIAAKAAEMQAAAQRAKRQRRDALFKTQAQKRAEAQAVHKAAVAVEDAAATAEKEEGEMSSSRKAKSQVPNLLPAEFLESDDSDSDGSDANPGQKRRRGAAAAAAAAAARRPKKIKFETAERAAARDEGRGPVDQRVGGTVYRVLKARGDERLAPKKSKYAAHQKNALLARGRVPVRRSSGFLLRK
ncbi:hypothetical protein MAPG_06330 [Magnaporthiopsis poae ATCC 64411]|uniref:Uncharacterized protein n=1 Tax=Magnaporthiopsis poae (strain ATCC 64411 / 73-15) TaxID=644358 RepID=A0A0C4E1R0_MAGP6|nr:hypothetical protein MAPG_06330 [Magnaporthiopsis poae ATCC 64411]